MTVSSDVNKSGPYNGNGVTTIFDYDFEIRDENHLKVIKTVVATGIETVLTIDTHYIVSDVNNPNGGQIALLTAPQSTEAITILRNVPFVQETDLENQGPYYAETVEEALDLAVMRDQQLAEEVGRSVKIPASADPEVLGSLINDVIRLAESADNIDTVAGIRDEIEQIAPYAETIAENVTDINTFARVYLGPHTVNPLTRSDGSPLQEGDIYYNTTTKGLRAYDGENWQTFSGQALNVLGDHSVGDGVETEFPISREPLSDDNILVFIDGIRQRPTVDYTISGLTIVFAVPPGDGEPIDSLVIGTTTLTNEEIAALEAAAVTVAAKAEEVEEARVEVVGARDDVRTKYLGGFDHFPTEAELGFAFVDGVACFVHDQPNASDNGLYVWLENQWNAATVSPSAFWRSLDIFVTSGMASSGVVTVPGGYSVGGIEVFRNGGILKQGPAPAIGDLADDYRGDDGSTIVFAAGHLVVNDWIHLRLVRPFSVAGIAAGDILLTPVAGLTATDVQVAVEEIMALMAVSQSNAGVLVSSSPGTGLPAGPTIDIELAGGYRQYEIRADFLEPVTANTPLYARFSFDGGVTFEAGATAYKLIGGYRQEGTSGEADWSSTGATAMFIGRPQPASAGNSSKLHFELSMSTGSRRTLADWVFVHDFTGPLPCCVRASARCMASAARPTHIRLQYSTGNFAAGARWQLYGMRG